MNCVRKIACFGLFVLWGSALLGEPRKWTAVDGREMQATFVRVDESGAEPQVVFRMPTGLHARVALSMLSNDDQEFIAERLKAMAAEAELPAGSVSRDLTDFEQFLANVIRYREGSSLRRRPPAEFIPREYYALYFSAEWCPPCRNFTPDLVGFYHQMMEAEGDIEVVLVSSDRDERAMREYMSGYDMPFPTVDFGRVDEVRRQVERLRPLLAER